MAANGSKLSDEVKTYIVQALACFDSPSTVVASVKTEFGEIISRQLVEMYDPGKRAWKAAPKWRTIFDETRKTFLEDTSKIGISHRAVRLRTLQRMAEKAETQGNVGLAAQLLEQAAKEVGGSFTNRREVTGRDGGPIKTEGEVTLDASALTTDQLRAVAAIRIAPS